MVKLEVKNASSNDKGIYNLIAKNEKGEVVSNPIEVKEVVEEKLDKPSIDQKLKSIVSCYDIKYNVLCIFLFSFSNFFRVLIKHNGFFILLLYLYLNLLPTHCNDR